jgi:hypothetical protein
MGGATAGVRNNLKNRANPPMTMEFGPLSPELALVDPELAERARHALRLAAQAAPRTPPVEVPPNTELPLRPPRWHRRLTLAAAALAVPSIILNVALLRDTAPVVDLRAAVPIGGVAAASTTIVETTRRPDAAPRPRPAASRAAKPARAVAAHRVLRWKKLPAARVYDVVIWRDGRRVRDVWTREPSVSVRSIACASSGAQLAKGSYLWFVYPVHSAAGSKRFGKLARWGNFRVDAATCSRPAARLLQSD